ncbi:hypothetical protein FA15DRAFT_703853 [Coprinopsis marcescibilis]|uniref:EamA domain-containing protein n=1 Tax=Coprinopsis marcescibilis TaxID=230819 RepID=A0A5C3KYP2_COPMA|nr:hypothetical protein FA15DRAFT_703853 [Coprinopsis marcescibilis]
MSASTRIAYQQPLTPSFADDASQNTPLLAEERPGSSTAWDQTTSSEEDALGDAPRESWTRRLLSSLKRVVMNNAGMLLIAAAQIFFSLMNVTVKRLNGMDPPVSALELVAVRMSVQYLCCIVYILVNKVPDPWLGPKGVRLLLVFRGFTGFVSLFGMYYSLQYLSLSDATVLQFLAPMCTAVVGALLLGETFTFSQSIAGFVSIAGVVLIARPASIFGPHVDSLLTETVPSLVRRDGDYALTSDRSLAVGIALVGVVGATGAYISLRAIGKRAHPFHAMNQHAGQSVIVSAIGMALTREKFIIPTSIAWLAMMCLMGIFGFFAQLLLTLGLQRETAGRGSMSIYTQIVFATIFERVFFNAVPPLLSVIGTFLIISSAVYVALSKERQQATPQDIRLSRTSEDALESGLLQVDVNIPDAENGDKNKGSTGSVGPTN